LAGAVLDDALRLAAEGVLDREDRVVDIDQGVEVFLAQVEGHSGEVYGDYPLRTPRGWRTLSDVEWPLLADVPPQDVREVLSIARRRSFAKGEVVFHRDDPADTLHLIVKGRFAVRITTPLGDSSMLEVLGPGEAFGELSLLSPGARRSATVSALEASETRSVLRNDFILLQRRHPGVKDVLLRLLAEQLRRASDQVVEAHYVDADTRVRRRLLKLAGTYGPPLGPAEVPLTQEEIAQMAGTSRATVNRVLRDERERGTVELRRGRTIVLDREDIIRRSRVA
jgi:CRP/FNR family transcriptional regulator, cyclic AMP receptor protein